MQTHVIKYYLRMVRRHGIRRVIGFLLRVIEGGRIIEMNWKSFRGN